MDKNENSKAAHEGGAKKNHAVYAAVAIVALVALAAVFFGMQKPPEAKQAAASEFFFSSMDKMLNASEYSLEFREIVGGVENKYVIVQAKNGMFASAQNVVDERAFYVLEDGMYACEKFGNFSVCSDMRLNGSAFKFFEANLAQKFFGKQQVQQDKEFVAALEKFGAAVFDEKIVEKTVNGIECRQVTYELDYGKLSLNQLNQLGIPASSPVVTQFSDYKISLCIDEASGIAVQTVLSYKFNNEQRSYTREYAALKVGGAGEIKAPLVLENVAKFEDIFAQASAENAVNAACSGLIEGEAAKCYKGIALDRNDGRFCSRITAPGEASRCYLMVAVQASQAQTCEKAGELRDDCLFEIGAGDKRLDVCAMIVDANRRSECSGFAGNGTVAPPVNQTQAPTRKIECVVDSDCAPAGCSNIACAPLNSSIATTCEYSPVYACFEKAFCGCRQNACSWYKGEEYNACVNEFETSQVEDFIKQKAAEASNATAANESE